MNGAVRLLPKPPDELLFALFGGFLTGVGAALGTGCVVGNIMSGWALMSVGMILFGLVTIAANWVTTYVYLMGGQRTKYKRKAIPVEFLQAERSFPISNAYKVTVHLSALCEECGFFEAAGFN